MRTVSHATDVMQRVFPREVMSWCVHTQCQGTSAPGRVQNGALSTLWVPKFSFVHFAPSADVIFAKGA